VNFSKKLGHDFGSVPVYSTRKALESERSADLSSPAERTDQQLPGAEHSPAQAQSKAKAKTKSIPSDKERPTDAPAEEAAEQEPEDEEEVGEEEEEEHAAAAEPVIESAKTKGITFEVVASTTPPPGGSLFGKMKCPATRPRTPGFTGVSKSTAAQIAAMGACDWGITHPDPMKVTTSTCKDGGNWQLRVKKVKSRARTFSRQIPGQQEPTTGNSTSGNFCQQVSDLDNLGNCPGNWYMLSAVKAHEAVHVQEWKTSAGSDWPAQQAIIEGLSVPASGATKSSKAATKNMRSSAAFQNALKTNRGSGNYPAFWGIPDPNADTNAAERVIVGPRIKQICVHARSKGWTPSACPVCVANGIT
jgi:hypothetical protein